MPASVQAEVRCATAAAQTEAMPPAVKQSIAHTATAAQTETPSLTHTHTETQTDVQAHTQPYLTADTLPRPEALSPQLVYKLLLQSVRSSHDPSQMIKVCAS